MYPYDKSWVCWPNLTTEEQGSEKQKQLLNVLQICTWGHHSNGSSTEDLCESSAAPGFVSGQCAAEPRASPGTGAPGSHRGHLPSHIHLCLVSCCRSSGSYHRESCPSSSAAQLVVPFFVLIHRRKIPVKGHSDTDKFAKWCCQEANILMSDSPKCITLT